MLPSRGWLQNM